MKKYWILSRVMLKNMLASMNPMNGGYEDGKRKKKAYLRALLLGVIVLIALGSIIYLEYEIFRGLRFVRMPMMLPGVAIFASMMFALVMGLFQCLSELFQGKDAPFLAVLPLTSRQVFAARLTTLYLSELAVDAVICLPAFVLYAIGQGSAWPVALTALPVLLLLPLIPLAIVSLLASLLMRVSFFSRHRETVVMILSTLLAIGYSVGVTLTNSGQDMDTAQLILLLTSENGLLNRLLSALPPALWATKGLTGSFEMLALFAAVSLGCAAAVLLIAGPGYLDQALSSTEKTVTRRKNGSAFAWKSSSAFAALHALEWRELLRTPAWAFNSLMGVVMFPLMICIGFITGFARAGDGIGEMRALLSQVEPGYVALITTAVILLGAMVNPAVSTAISREGGRWPFALTLPVRQKTRFLTKMMVGLEINLICMVMITAVAWFLVRMPILWLLAAFAVAALVGLASASLSLWVDASRPQLSWTTEMEAIKKNFNQVIGMLIWVVLTALCVVPAVLLWNRGGGTAMAAVAGVSVVEALIGLLLLNRVSEKNIALPE